MREAAEAAQAFSDLLKSKAGEEPPQQAVDKAWGGATYRAMVTASLRQSFGACGSKASQRRRNTKRNARPLPVVGVQSPGRARSAAMERRSRCAVAPQWPCCRVRFRVAARWLSPFRPVSDLGLVGLGRGASTGCFRATVSCASTVSRGASTGRVALVREVAVSDLLRIYGWLR